MNALRRHPGFFLLAIALLGCGVAAATLLFAVADALLLRPLPVKSPQELVRLVSVRPQLGRRSYFRQEMAEAWRQAVPAFATLGIASEMSVAYRDGEQVERVLVSATSPSYLETFGVQPALGASFGADEGQTALLSHAFWQRRYQGDAAVVGRPVRIHGLPFTIVGVLPPGFNGATVESGPDVRVGLAALARFTPDAAARRDLDFEVVARLKPGESRAAAQAVAHGVYTARAHPEFDGPLAAHEFELESLERGASRLRTQAAGAVWVACGAAALLTLMVCVSLSGLLLARAVGRQGEFAVRRALGASGWQLAALVLGEVGVVVAGAMVLAAGLTGAGLRALTLALPPVRLLGRTTVPMALPLELDWRVAAFGAAVCLLALALIALAPAWRAARTDLQQTLRSARHTPAARGRGVLLMAQVALCTALLLAAGLIQATLEELRGHRPPEHVVTCDIDRLLVPGLSDERFAAAAEEWRVRVAALPGVRHAAFSAIRRLRGSGLKTTFVPAGEVTARAHFMNTSMQMVGPDYFAAAGAVLLAGRALTPADYAPQLPRPVVVSEAFARQFGGVQAVVGRQFDNGGREGRRAEKQFVVVGVVANGKYRSMREADPPVVYAALGKGWDTRTLTVRGDLTAAALAGPLRAALRDVAPELTVEEITDFAQDVEASLWNERAVAWLSRVFAALATVMAAAGLFAFVAYLVAARRREIGIRIAVGARPADVMALVLRHGLAPVAAGVAAGLLVGWALGRLAQAFLYGVRPGEPAVMLAAAGAMALVGTAACLLPAWRASRIAPAVALRTE